MSALSDLLLPGQPVPVAQPIPQIGDGLYMREGLIRAGVVGVPQRDGSVRPEYLCPRVLVNSWIDYFYQKASTSSACTKFGRARNNNAPFTHPSYNFNNRR